MELAVIGRRLCEPPTGVGRYLTQLLANWAVADSPFDRIVVYTPSEPQLPESILEGRVELRVVPSRLSPLLWENLTLLPYLRTADLIFGAYTVPLARAHDAVVSNLGIYESRPADFSLRSRLRTTPFFWQSARESRLVIANSQSTRHDVMTHYGVAPDHVKVIYLGVDEMFKPPSAGGELPACAVREKYGLDRAPFFLFVGKLSKRRHIPWLVEAFAAARHDAAIQQAAPLAPNLLIVGPGEIDVPALARRFGVEASVRHITYVPIEDLLPLYQAATALVHPTAHEGFSLPIAEAMACGTPVIAFDHASLELGLREAVIVVSQSPGGIAAGLRSAHNEASDSALRAQRSAIAAATVRQLDWKLTAENTMEALRRLGPRGV